MQLFFTWILVILKKKKQQTKSKPREKIRRIVTFFAKIALSTLDWWLAGEVIKACSWSGEPTIFKNSLFKAEQYKCECSNRHKAGYQGSLPWPVLRKRRRAGAAWLCVTHCSELSKEWWVNTSHFRTGRREPGSVRTLQSWLVSQTHWDGTCLCIHCPSWASCWCFFPPLLSLCCSPLSCQSSTWLLCLHLGWFLQV